MEYKHNSKLMFVPSSYSKSEQQLLSSQAGYLHCCTDPFFKRPGGLCDVPCFSFPFWLLRVTLQGCVMTGSPGDRKALRGWQTWAQPLGWPLSHWVCWVVSEMVQGYHS